MRVTRYSDEFKSDWDLYLSKCRNKHFMFNRDYMEYHKDRFNDHSLIIFDDKNRIISLLPANESGTTIFTHQGLTFGGFLSCGLMTTEKMLEVFSVVLEYYKSQGMDKLIYKKMPYIYSDNACEEDLYALFRINAELYRRDVSSTIFMSHRLPYHRSRSFKKAIKNGVTIKEVDSFDAYWKLLNDVLSKQHGVNPVHTLDEITHLGSIFKDNIKCYLAYHEDEVLAGSVVFENENIVHCQYLASNDLGRKLGALDLVIHHLIAEVYPEKSYFDFGNSNEDNGKYLNTGLIFQKEAFGARAVVHDFYEINING